MPNSFHLPFVLLFSCLLLLIGCEPTTPPKESSPPAANPAPRMRVSEASSEAPALTSKEAAPQESPLAVFQGSRTHPIRGGLFHNGQACSFCHSNHVESPAMRDPEGNAVAPYDLWQSSMMANAARDPFWRAVVSAEIAEADPSMKEEIEAICTRCHTPMTSVNANASKGPSPSMSLIGTSSVAGQLATDGVSCALCHQIQEEGLGTSESFSGGFKIGSERIIYGPYSKPFAEPMKFQSNFTLKESQHIRSAALCATCHTLETQPLGSTKDTPFFQEQTPYLEWKNSIFNNEVANPSAHAKACQGCHMPTVDPKGNPIETRIARTPHGDEFGPAVPRKDYGQHFFIGGNTVVPGMIRDHPEIFRSPAPKRAFDATIARVREQLQKRSALLSIEGEREGEEVVLNISLHNLTGHKFPTGHPSRRAWIQVLLKDAKGIEVFSSGRFDARGRLINGEKILASEKVGGPTQPHHAEISSPDQVHLLESSMVDLKGDTTFGLLKAARYQKDSRLLPRGWSNEFADIQKIAPQGLGDDQDFTGGVDVVHYRLKAPLEMGPYSVEATLFYQPLGGRYVAEILKHETPEIRAFEQLLIESGAGVEWVAKDAIEVK